MSSKLWFNVYRPLLLKDDLFICWPVGFVCCRPNYVPYHVEIKFIFVLTKYKLKFNFITIVYTASVYISCGTTIAAAIIVIVVIDAVAVTIAVVNTIVIIATNNATLHNLIFVNNVGLLFYFSLDFI